MSELSRTWSEKQFRGTLMEVDHSIGQRYFLYKNRELIRSTQKENLSVGVVAN